jgi:thiamine biosynthesis protein ThiS
MQLKVNGKTQEVDEGSSVQELLVQLEIGPDGVAIALNDRVLPRAQWAKRVLLSGDAIEVVRAVGGG